MELTGIIIKKIVEMLLILLIGGAAFRCRVIDNYSNKKLSDLLLLVVSPALIITSYQMDFDVKLLAGLGMAACLSLVSFVLAIAVSQLLVRQNGPHDLSVERISVVYSNCGFIGIPLINGVLGKEGVFYMTAYITVFNLLIWSHGVILMCGKGSVRETLKNFCTPSTAAIAIGVVLFLARIRLPEVLYNSLETVGSMNTPLAMIVAGGNLAESSLMASLTQRRTYYLSFLKLILIPALTLLVLSFTGVPRTILLTVMIGAACPTGAMGTMFALRYQKDSCYAAELFAATTLLAVLTVPLVTLMAGYLI